MKFALYAVSAFAIIFGSIVSGDYTENSAAQTQTYEDAVKENNSERRSEESAERSERSSESG